SGYEELLEMPIVEEGGKDKDRLNDNAGTDDMMMTLLAGQAAVDCGQLPVGAWEEVEQWKKELSLLSTRLSALVARHQREVKILTAAKTLQKLNNTNKSRISKQTMESLEQSEKRVEAAEKELLLLRDREANLRRRLMEHWSGVMAWEVRRLERVHSDTQARYNLQSKQIASVAQRERQLLDQIHTLEDDAEPKVRRIVELEEMVLELGRRERAMEEEVQLINRTKSALEKERNSWILERQEMEKMGGRWEDESRGFERDREGWMAEKRILTEERQRLIEEHRRILDNGRTSDRDKAMMDQMRIALGDILRRNGTVPEGELLSALNEVKGLVRRREKEVGDLREEMKEVNMGLEEEVRRVSTDRDVWKSKAEKITMEKQTEIAVLEKHIRSQTEQLSDLSLKNESLTSSLSAAQNAISSLSDQPSAKSLQTKVDALTAELDSIAGQFTEVWTLLPPLNKRLQADLVDQQGKSNSALVSPSRQVNFAALQEVYKPTNETFGGIDEMVGRIRGMAEDGKVLVARMEKVNQEREVHKANAAKAKKLVEDSRHSLETYQQQVAVLEDRLAKSGASESHFLEEMNNLRSSLDAANNSRRQLEIRLAEQTERADRLAEANNTLSTRALEMAEEVENERKTLTNKWQGEMERLNEEIRECHEDADEQRSRGQAQRIQLLDELNSLQAEVADLRKQLR
ncbi:hypothetical protein TREMEDRAFT_12085, partial [Tremella mesenterica DSM 1558]|uniref:uncharacterized protein n=1 Tax=Tremella mesenterica (strain ATCC 24925 / CBS 8224 / DSM 1558 / NBRC 9311 / NRRL Y-6157 / RJB 2259-6 / UBC 559-6) TaxID=578456 RepID=UPI00032CD0CA